MMAEQTALRKEETQATGSTRASSFYAAMRIMPPTQRSAMYAIYQYCRAIDDIADSEGDPQQRLHQLQEWRAYVDQLYAGQPPASLKDLARAVSDFGLQKQDMLTVIDGMEMDVRGPIQAPDLATLYLYCDRVACAVGRLSVRVFGMQEQDGIDLAYHLGLALQLTNILRDIDEDAAMGRLYLPKEFLENAGIHITSPMQVINRPEITVVCSRLADKVLDHFHEADIIMKRYERSHLRTPRVMSQAYHSILNNLIERGFAPPRKHVCLSKIKLGYILVRNILF